MSGYELFGWLAFGLNVWGNLALTKKNNKGWLIRLGCNAAWLVYSAAFGVWPLFANHAVFAVINVYGWREWTKGKYRCTCGREWGMEKFQTTCICEAVIPGKD